MDRLLVNSLMTIAITFCVLLLTGVVELSPVQASPADGTLQIVAD